MSVCELNKIEAQKTCCSWKVELGPMGLPGADGSGIRRINADETWHVETTGSDDAGDGTTGSPFATIQGALNELQKYRIAAGATLTIQLGAGEWVVGTSVNGVGIEVRHLDGARVEIQGQPPTNRPTAPVMRDWGTDGLGAKQWGLGGDWTKYDTALAAADLWENKAGVMEPSDPWTAGGARRLRWSADSAANLAMMTAAWPTRIRVTDDCLGLYLRGDLKLLQDIALVADPSPNFTHQWRSAVRVVGGMVNLKRVAAWGFPMSFYCLAGGSMSGSDCAALYSSDKLPATLTGTEEGQTGFSCDVEAHMEIKTSSCVGCIVRGHAQFKNGWVTASTHSGVVVASDARLVVNGTKVSGNGFYGVRVVDGGALNAWGPGTIIEANAEDGIYAHGANVFLLGTLRANHRYAMHLDAATARVESGSVIAVSNNDNVTPQVMVDNGSRCMITRPGTPTLPTGTAVTPTHEQLDPALSRGFSWVYDGATTTTTFATHHPATSDLVVPEIRSGLQTWTSPEIDVPGANFGDYVRAGASVDLQGMILTGAVKAPDKVVVTILNHTGGAITLGTVKFHVSVRPHV